MKRTCLVMLVLVFCCVGSALMAQPVVVLCEDGGDSRAESLAHACDSASVRYLRGSLVEVIPFFGDCQADILVAATQELERALQAVRQLFHDSDLLATRPPRVICIEKLSDQAMTRRLQALIAEISLDGGA